MEFDRREQQGWKAEITTGTNEKQLVQVTALEPSVLSVVFDVSTGTVDDAGTITVETRVNEALRRRSFNSRDQGISMNVPAGLTRVYCSLFIKPYVVWVTVARGIVTTEHITFMGQIPPGGTNVQRTPQFARSVRVVCLVGGIDVAVPGGGVSMVNVPGTQPQSVEIAALGSLTINNSSAVTNASFAAIWEVTA